METRDQIRHLLRRFGLGASPSEVAALTSMGVDGAIKHLIDYEQVDEQFPISPWEICFEPDKPDMYVDPPRIGIWWGLRMLMTQRPLQENLTLFWHNHFAVGAEKVEFGPMMCDYIDVLRRNAQGHFPTLLREVSTTPAMLRWLDTDTSVKLHPNENFARELMELFTIGIGAYTEGDVKEGARAFTGWGLRYLIFEQGGENVQTRLKDAVKTGEPMVVFCLSPELMDTGPKTVLGQSGKFEGDDVLDLVAARPETATRLCKKLWEWFAYPEPDPKIVDKLAATFRSNDLHIKPILKEIAGMSEFWGEKCVRQKVKSPADFIVPILRQYDLNSFLGALRPANTTPMTPLHPILRATGGLIWLSMSQQGLQLLYPPDVSGWRWGKAWLSTQNMAERMKFAGTINSVGNPDKGLPNYLATRIITQHKPTTDAAFVDALLEMFDIDLPSSKRDILVRASVANGGPAALSKPESASALLYAIARLIFASSEFQMC